MVVSDVRTEPREGGVPTEVAIDETGGTCVRLDSDVSRWDDIDRLVARAVEMKADAPAIFDRVRAMAAAAGAPAPARVAPGMAKGRKRPPRLTEAWFC